MSIQAAIDRAQLGREDFVALPRGRIALERPLVIREGVTVQGAGRPSYSWNSKGMVGGTILEVTFRSDPAITLHNGGNIGYVGFDYPDQHADFEEPIKYAPTIDVVDEYGVFGFEIRNCDFHKAYIAIRLGQAVGIANGYVVGNTGCPLHTGLDLDFVVDWCTIRDNHFNAGRAVDYDLAKPLLRSISERGAAARVYSCDWLTLHNLQAWGYRFGAVISPHTFERSGPYVIDGCSFDACQTGVQLQGEFKMPVRIFRSNFCPFNKPANRPGTAVDVLRGARVPALDFNGNFIFGPAARVIWSYDTIDSMTITGNRSDVQHASGAAYYLSTRLLADRDNLWGGFHS